MKIVVAFLSMSCLTAFGDSTEFVPLQQRAQGQSLTGASLLNDSLFSNPASSAFTQVYSVDASFLSSRNFAVSVLDTKTSAIGGALGYARTIRPGFEAPLQSARLGLSGRVSENIGIGLLGKTVWGPDLDGNTGRFLDVDLGALANFNVLQLGITLTNLFGGSVPMGAERAYSFGARLNWEETLFLSASVLGRFSDFSPVQFGVGAEYVSPYYFAIKGGYRNRTLEAKGFWSAGLSILSPKVSIHYALEVPDFAGQGPEHSVGTTFLF
jgi:hypothetical protein